MGAEAWLNIVSPRPMSHPKVGQKARSSPTADDTGARVLTRNPGWFWVNQNMVDTSVNPLKCEGPTLSTAGQEQYAAVVQGPSVGTPQYSNTQPCPPSSPLSRNSSATSSWQDITVDDALSSEDLSDCEDTNIVSVAPCRTPHVAEHGVPAFVSASKESASRISAPPAAAMLRATGDAISATSCRPAALGEKQSRYENTELPELRLRPGISTASMGRCGSLNTKPVGACAPNSDHAHNRSQAMCGVNTDSDLIWTFLAGMMLYVMSM